MEKRLIDKVLLVTGGAAGLGLSIGHRFAQEGARVVLADVNLEGAQKVAADIEKAGGKAIAVQLDVRNLDQIQNMVDQADKAFGRIDGLVNNAGVSATLLF